jgi:glycosyltransferase involved in cell wall biosynthesis
MAKPSPRDPVTVVIPVHNAADRLGKLVPAWSEMLAKLGRGYEILVVDDGSTDTTAAALEQLANRVPYLRVLRHDARRGFGASLRTALAEAKHPLFFYTSSDYPYTPADLRRMLERIEVRDEVFGKQPDLISGCRTGRPKPWLVKWGGRAWRLLWRVLFGMPLQPSPTWLGWREARYRWLVGWLFGVPLADVNSAFKLYRTAFLRRFPIQSDGDFVHTELVAKATFLTSIMDELPLTPKPDAEPVPSVRSELWRVFRHPDFGTPPRDPSGRQPGGGEPGAPVPDAAPPAVSPVPDARELHGTPGADAPGSPPPVP